MLKIDIQQEKSMPYRDGTGQEIPFCLLEYNAPYCNMVLSAIYRGHQLKHRKPEHSQINVSYWYHPEMGLRHRTKKINTDGLGSSTAKRSDTVQDGGGAKRTGGGSDCIEEQGLAEMGTITLEKRRLQLDLQQTFKILNNKDNVDWRDWFEKMPESEERV